LPYLFSRYSAWGSPAEPRMVAAATAAGLSPAVLSHLTAHGSTLLTAAEVADVDTVLVLVTSTHKRWTEESVGRELVAAAFAERRIILLDPAGGDVTDPYFGDERHYAEVRGTRRADRGPG